MKLQSARDLFLSPRLAAIVLAIAAITGCSMSTTTSTSDEGTNTSGPYATNQQAIKGSGVACPARGVGVQYLLCLEAQHNGEVLCPTRQRYHVHGRVRGCRRQRWISRLLGYRPRVSC